MMVDLRRVLLVGLLLTATACAANSLLFHPGPRPPELTGVWIDVEKTTAADTSAWVLSADGSDLSAHFRAGKRSEKRYGSWYLAGSLGDTTGRALCFQRRPRDGATCRAFRLDTLSDAPQRRRLTVRGYPGTHHVSERILIEQP